MREGLGVALAVGVPGAWGEAGGAQPLSAKPKAMREAHGARRRRAGCAPFLREAEMCGGDIDTGGGEPYYNGVI